MVTCVRCLGEVLEADLRSDGYACLPCLQNEAQAMIMLDIQRLSMLLENAGIEFELVEVLFEDKNRTIVEVLS